ncbi:amidohydrolase family protein [Paraburkholderia sp. CNPSo 3076]|uniref:amidohydrolase family protein n=1 Tax=Paraburkholderia sp. CNPSo 3076 TaxID=2940936 RepID=UPI00224F6872|nr:amidohydrolase family protein [Paraburkholderia sp. CNPSo 3076]MCX5543603.1 amidohydrolase family protein [Paraburkholderia sp. CNPSo 3076]
MATIERIDAHQHYWDPARSDYGWLTPSMTALYRAFGPADLAPLRASCGVARTVVVQAAPTVEETRWLLDLARNEPSIAGVVGWVPLDDPHVATLIAELAREPKLRGVRPMLQDLPDDDWIENADTARGVEALIAHDLAFDALVFTRHAHALATFLARNPALRVVIDHGAKPPIADGGENGYAPWSQAISRFARFPQVHCKLSGLATEAAPGWNDATLAPWVAHLLAAFGPQRLMWGSDWPVLNLNADYVRWHASAQQLTQTLSADERAAVFGGNAAAFYRLKTGLGDHPAG